MGVVNIARHLVRTRLVDLLLSESAITQLGQRRLKHIIQFARERSPFYRELYRDLPADGFALADLPTVDKDILMDHFEELHTVRGIRRDEVVEFASHAERIGELFQGRHVLTHTSGTSGFQGYFLYDRPGWDIVHALYMARAPEKFPLYQTLYRMIKKISYAVIIPLGGHFATLLTSEMAPRAKRLFFRTEMYSILLPIDDLVHSLNRLNPEIVHVYPSTLSVLIQEAEAGRLKVRPKYISSASEFLPAHVKQHAEQTFHSKVVQRYGTTECVMIGSSCEHDRLHLFHDWVTVENMDAQSQPVPKGEVGNHIFLTCHYNHLQPLIRYRLDDSLRFHSDRCSCGSKLPSFEVEGRAYPNFRLRGISQPLMEVAPVSFQVVLIRYKQILTFQMVREADDFIRLKLVFLPSADVERDTNKAVRELTEYMQTQGVHPSVRIVPEVVDRLPPDPKTGKLRLFVTENEPTTR